MVSNGFNPSEKYARQIGSFPQVGVNTIKTCLKPPPRWSIYLRTNALFHCNAQGTSPKDYTLKTLVVPNKTGPTGYSEQTYSSKSEIQR